MDVCDLNLRHLLAVAAVVQSGSLSAALPLVSLSQPALTQAIARLETQLGQVLFERHPGGMTPTEAGRLLAARASRARGYIARGVQLARRTAQLPTLAAVERRVTLGQLRAVMEVDQRGSYAVAAQRVGVSQPAMYRAISELSDMVGVPLMVRRGKAVQPTLAATRMLRFVRLARAELQAGVDELASLRPEGAGRIVFGALPVARAVLLPLVLARFTRAYPNASVTVVEGPYQELLGHLREGSLDLVVGAMRAASPSRDVRQIPLFADDPVIVARAGHPLAGRAFTFGELLDFPWVMAAPGAPLRMRWEAMFADRGLAPPRLRVESGSVMIIRGLLLEDDWLTLMARDQFVVEKSAGLLCDLGTVAPGLRREIGATVRTDWHPTRMQAVFMDTLQQASRDRGESGEWPFQYG